MVWGGISIGGRTDLHIIRNGTLTGRRYADEILRPHVIPYPGAIGDSFVFQDDNARPHRAHLVENMLEAETIQRMELPACSPDLNPIEHVWDMLRRRIAARPRPPATVRDLEIALLEEWNSIPQSLIDNFIASVANRKKRNIKASITKYRNKTEEEIEKLNNVGLLARKNRFLEFRTEVKDILDSIISICEEKDEETYCTEKDDILDTLEEILVAIDTQLMPSVVNSDFEVKNQGSCQSLVSARSAEVKLPTLSLPIFSGVTEEWLAFSDLFEAAVSNNNDLTGAQKLQYLKGSLKSDALKIVNSLSITNDNFEIAWKLLKDRYFNKREIISSLFKKFVNITPLSGESSTQILNLLDSTKEFVRMLESLEYQVDPTSDTLLMHMILFKLDPNSSIWFERTFSTDVIPMLDELLQFLATQARSITSSTTKRNVQRKVALVASNAQLQCSLCNAEHTLSRCATFLKLSVQGRSDFVKTNNVCFNCLTQFHSVKTYKSKFRCKKCKKPHHSLLHIENVSDKGRQGAVNVLNSRELSVNAPVFSPVPISGTSEQSENSRVVDITSCISDVNPDVQILLFTALIQVRDIWGNYKTCRCLLDSGSQTSLITNECIERLGLRKEKANVSISCLGASDSRTNGLTEIQFTPHTFHLKILFMRPSM
ncbi:integrase catalytic domain-containing protein [Trichonephila clavipes]|nr:integrase catalytic domain-containing protein [Trichonephila clavipes]